MNSREIALWVDSRWCDALKSATGKTMDELMQEQVDALIRTLPQDVQDRINEEIGLSLEEAGAQYLSENQAVAQTEVPTSEFVSQVEMIRKESHQSIDTKCDALIRKAILGGEDTDARLIPLRGNLSCLKGEKPSAVILPGKNMVPVKNWRQAVTTIMRDCAADPDRRTRLMEMSDKIIGNFRTILGHRAEGMNVPIEICEGLYMEGKFDTGALLHVLTDRILPNTGYDYQSVLFQLREPELEQAPTQMEPTM